MAGFDAVYVPGWDCHGLTVEVGEECFERQDISKSTAIYSRYTQRKDYETFIKDFPDIGLKYHFDPDRMIHRSSQLIGTSMDQST
jgi:hypothetical protein